MPSIQPMPADIRALREQAGITQSDAAKRVCVTLRTWQRWEAGDRAISPGHWRLCKMRIRAKPTSC